MAGDNRTLGKFHLDSIPPAPRGVPQIQVTFDIDANGILNVSAKDKGTGKEQKITITSSSGLSDAEIEKMKADAEAHAADDAKKKELVEERNKAENMVHLSEKTLKEAGDKAKPEDKREVEDAVTALKAVMHGDDVAKIKEESEKLSTLLQKIGAAMYEQAAAEAPKPEEELPKDDGTPDTNQPEEPKTQEK
jgi:molecular chaperone DnaK